MLPHRFNSEAWRVPGGTKASNAGKCGFPHCDNHMARPLPKSIDETHKLLGEADYVADRSLATALYLGLAMQRPLFLEGEAGVGKTEIAKVISSALRSEERRVGKECRPRWSP